MRAFNHQQAHGERLRGVHQARVAKATGRDERGVPAPLRKLLGEGRHVVVGQPRVQRAGDEVRLGRKRLSLGLQVALGGYDKQEWAHPGGQSLPQRPVAFRRIGGQEERVAATQQGVRDSTRGGSGSPPRSALARGFAEGRLRAHTRRVCAAPDRLTSPRVSRQVATADPTKLSPR